MTTNHPEIAIGEPIPKIRPRINRDRLEMNRAVSYGYCWCIGMMLVMIVVVIAADFGYAIRFLFLGCALTAWVGVSAFARKNLKKPLRVSGDNQLQRDALRAVPWDIPLRDNIRFYMLIIAMILLTQVLVMAGYDFSGTLMYLSMYTLYGGIVLIVLGARAREPGQISCEKCSYALTGLTLPCMCPECGGSILDQTFTTDRPRIRWPWLWRGGMVMIVLGGSLTYLSFAKPAFFYRAIPKAALNVIATGDDRAFEQLIAKPMSIEEKVELIDSLIEQSEDDWMGSARRNWLEVCYLDGSMRPDQVKAIMEGLPPIVISGPETVQVGQSIEVSLRSSLPTLASRSLVPSYYFRGFVVDDQTELHEGSKDARRWLSLLQDRLERFARNGIQIDQPTYTFAAKEAGTIVVRARVVLVLTDINNSKSFAWNEDGDGVFANEPDWVQTIDLECVIKVK